MKTLSFLEVHHLVKELHSLEGSKITKIYNKSNTNTIIQLYSSKLGKKFLNIVNNKIIFIDDRKETYDTPSTICLRLRKNLEGSKILKIDQIRSERVIELLLTFRDQKKRLIIELFSKGNLILCDNDYKVILATFYHKWKDREIKPNIKYEFPKKDLNTFNMSIDEFRTLIISSNKESIVKSLALDVGIGGVYAEEICLNAKIDKLRSPNSFEEKDINILFDHFNYLLRLKLKPQIILKDKEIIDIVPINLHYYNNFEKKEFKNFSKALSYYINHSDVIKPKKSQLDAERKKYEEIIKKQVNKIKEMEKSENEQRKKGEIIYEKYQLIDEILKQVKTKLKTTNLHDLKKSLKNNKIIKKIDPKEKTINVEI